MRLRTKQKERRRRSRRALLLTASDEEEEESSSSDRSTFHADDENSLFCASMHLQEETQESQSKRTVSFDLSRNVEYENHHHCYYHDRSSRRGGRMVLAGDDTERQLADDELEDLFSIIDSSLSYYTRQELKRFKHTYKTLCRSHSEYAVISGRVADADFYDIGIMTHRRKQNRSQVKAHIRMVLRLCNTTTSGDKAEATSYFESSAPLQVQNQTWESAREALQRGIQNAIDAYQEVSVSSSSALEPTTMEPSFEEIPLSPVKV